MNEGAKVGVTEGGMEIVGKRVGRIVGHAEGLFVVGKAVVGTTVGGQDTEGVEVDGDALGSRDGPKDGAKLGG